MYTILKCRHGLRPAVGTRRIAKPLKYFFSLTGFLIIAAAWQICAGLKPSPALPMLGSIFKTVFFLIRDGPYLRHVAASLSILLTGLGIAAAVGFAIGLLLYRYKYFNAAAYPVIECARGIASLTLFPLLIVLFGLGAQARVFVIFWTAWPAIVLSVFNSLGVDENVIDAAKICGAGDWRIIFSIRIPMAVQGIITGIRIGAGGAWIALIPAEMLGASKGLGYFLLWSSQSFEFEKVYAAIITIAAIGGLINFILMLIQKKLCQITGDLT